MLSNELAKLRTRCDDLQEKTQLLQHMLRLPSLRKGLNIERMTETRRQSMSPSIQDEQHRDESPVKGPLALHHLQETWQPDLVHEGMGSPAHRSYGSHVSARSSGPVTPTKPWRGSGSIQGNQSQVPKKYLQLFLNTPNNLFSPSTLYSPHLQIHAQAA